jgi:hypothetical protein
LVHPGAGHHLIFQTCYWRQQTRYLWVVVNKWSQQIFVVFVTQFRGYQRLVCNFVYNSLAFRSRALCVDTSWSVFNFYLWQPQSQDLRQSLPPSSPSNSLCNNDVHNWAQTCLWTISKQTPISNLQPASLPSKSDSYELPLDLELVFLAQG